VKVELIHAEGWRCGRTDGQTNGKTGMA